MTDHRDERVLLLLPVGRDAPLAHELLLKAGIRAKICLGLDGLVADLDDGCGLALVAEEALAHADLGKLTAWLDAEPAWSDVPFLVLTSGGDTYPRYLRAVQLSEKLRNITLLERPLQSISLISAIKSGLRARRRQYEVRTALDARDRVAIALQRLNETLEQRVADRTRRLESANQRLLAEREEHRRTEDALRQAQKMQAVGHLTGGIAHDFNNLLTVIAGNLEILRAKVGESPALERFVATALGATDRASRLTQQLLAFSRKQHLDPRPVSLNAVIIGMDELLRRTTGSIELARDLGDDLWPAMVDPNQMETALLNLVINARDACGERGTITIRTRNAVVGEDDAASFLDVVPGEYVQFSVEDDGCGMPPHVLARAFEPFFTTKQVGRGSGLGLSMIYGFVRQSKGHVRLDSEEGRGTTVTLYLPRAFRAPAMDDVAAPAVAAGFDRIAAGDSRKILVVEDDESVRDIAVSVLADHGYEVCEADGADRAIELLERQTDIAALFTDIVMPGAMNGIDLARLVAQRWPSVRIVVTSGYAERLVDSNQLPSQVVFLAKPYRPFDLVAKMRGTLRTAPAE
jgi:signal transduction histidine kinase